MKYLKEKDKRIRSNFLKIEKHRQAIKFLKSSPLLDNEHKTLVGVKLHYLCKKHSFVKIKNRCILSNRSKSILRRLSISRIKFREFVSLGLLPSYKKAIW